MKILLDIAPIPEDFVPMTPDKIAGDMLFRALPFLIGAVEKYPSKPALKCSERCSFAQPPIPKVGLLIFRSNGLSQPNWYPL